MPEHLDPDNLLQGLVERLLRAEARIEELTLLEAPLGVAEAVLAVTYTPNWTATGVAPALGDGTLAGRYAQAGQLVQVWLQLAMGSTTTYGTGAWEFSLPVAPAAGVRFPVGAAQIIDNGVADYIGVARLDQTTAKVRVITAAGATAATAVPHAWGNGDSLQFALAYYSA